MRADKVSFIKLFVKKQNKKSLTEYMQTLGSAINIENRLWDGNPEYLFSFDKTMDFGIDYVLVKMDVYDEDLLAGYPTDVQVEKQVNENIQRKRLVDAVENLLADLLAIEGVLEGSVAFRNSVLKKSEEIFAVGSGADGVYSCSIDALSKDEDWLA